MVVYTNKEVSIVKELPNKIGLHDEECEVLDSCFRLVSPHQQSTTFTYTHTHTLTHAHTHTLTRTTHTKVTTTRVN